MYGFEHDALVAAVRAVLDGREPDYVAGMVVATRWRDGLNDFAVSEMVHEIVDAALGGKQVRIIDVSRVQFGEEE